MRREEDACVSLGDLRNYHSVARGQVEGFSLAMGKLMLSGHVDEVVSTVRSNLRNL